MSDLMRMESHIQMIEARSKEILQQLKSLKETGQISTEVELKHLFFTKLYEFYSNIGKPTLKVREAWGPPYSSDYNSMMKEIQNDFFTLFSECSSLIAGYEEAFQQAETNHRRLASQIERFEQKVVDYGYQLQRKEDKILFRESFDDTSKFDKSFVSYKEAFITPEVGGLILSPSYSKKLEDSFIRILNESNGFPGNTHQVRVLDGEVKFYGETNPHWNPSDILDGNADTWFEFEKYYIEPQVKRETSGFGFDYEEKISWIFEEEERQLLLSYEVEYDYPQMINWLGLNPFLPSEKGANPAIIKSITLHDGKGKQTVISREEYFDEAKVWMFESQLCKKIIVSIYQPSAYETKIGHLFFKELESQSSHFMDNSKHEKGKRIEGEMPSLRLLGMEYSKQENLVKWSQLAQDFSLSQEEEDRRKTALFSKPVTESGVQADFEYINAYRHSIGIRDMNAFQYEFEEVSEYISTPFYSPNPIWMIELEADSYVPEEFSHYGNDWIQYYISVNDGQSWHLISPKNQQRKSLDVPKTYWVNTNTPKETRIRDVGYLETTESCHQVRVRIMIQRPNEQDVKGYTPIVKEIRLQASTRSEGIT